VASRSIRTRRTCSRARRRAAADLARRARLELLAETGPTASSSSRSRANCRTHDVVDRRRRATRLRVNGSTTTPSSPVSASKLEAALERGSAAARRRARQHVRRVRIERDATASASPLAGRARLARLASARLTRVHAVEVADRDDGRRATQRLLMAAKPRSRVQLKRRLLDRSPHGREQAGATRRSRRDRWPAPMRIELRAARLPKALVSAASPSVIGSTPPARRSTSIAPR